jgi:hypothetical protein
MRRIRDPQQKWMFDPFEGVLSEMARRRILSGWQGVFRAVVLKLLPVKKLAEHFSEDMGCQTKELYSMAGLVFLADFFDWNALEAPFTALVAGRLMAPLVSESCIVHSATKIGSTPSVDIT